MESTNPSLPAKPSLSISLGCTTPLDVRNMENSETGLETRLFAIFGRSRAPWRQCYQHATCSPNIEAEMTADSWRLCLGFYILLQPTTASAAKSHMAFPNWAASCERQPTTVLQRPKYDQLSMFHTSATNADIMFLHYPGQDISIEESRRTPSHSAPLAALASPSSYKIVSSPLPRSWFSSYSCTHIDDYIILFRRP